MEYLMPCLFSFVACIGFCIIYNVHGTGILICCFGGALGWLAYLLTALLVHSDVLQSFFAAVAITIYAEIVARIRQCPVTVYLLVALFPLVPGGGIYYTMRYCISGDTDLFLSTLLHTMGLAGSLAVGAMLVSSFVRLWRSIPAMWEKRRGRAKR